MLFFSPITGVRGETWDGPNCLNCFNGVVSRDIHARMLTCENIGVKYYLVIVC